MGILDKATGFLLKVFGSHNEREIKGLQSIVDEINELEAKLEGLSDEQLKAQAEKFREMLKNGSTLEDILPEAFASVRESSKRNLATATGQAMRHFDVQLMGGIVMHRGGIAEMGTGEGKTLVATLSAFLNALPGKGVHVITVNDYLARRDASWMEPVFNGLGLTVGAIQSHMESQERLDQYNCDITYGTNNEFGFDYLRDNMKIHPEDQCQKHHAFAIIDEVDSILIDEARTPLIISGASEDNPGRYADVHKFALQLEEDTHFELKEKEQSVLLTEEGIEAAEKLAGIDSFYSPANMHWPHMYEQALRAIHLYKADVHYVVKDGGIAIVDEFTGRLMEGRRWSDGLHQAIEAKEGLKIKAESQTYASITFQNFFRLYDKLSGMTGTAITEAVEFDTIYKLSVVQMPTNRPIARQDLPDVVYRTKIEKWKAICERIAEINETKRPVLVGTISIENSELLSEMLTRRGIKHNVLNAKFHEQEAEIVSGAGQAGRVTIATNMAGRGTDIVLGEGVVEAGGLYVLGTERHESRRIDNQLRGRCGRQGDPGTTEFFLALEDDLMRLFATDRVSAILERFGMKEGVEISSPIVDKAIARAQRKVEQRNFEIRKNLLDYDEVMDHQRKLIYRLRNKTLRMEDLGELVTTQFKDVATSQINFKLPAEEDSPNAAECYDDIASYFKEKYGFPHEGAELSKLSYEDLIETYVKDFEKSLDEKREIAGESFDRFIHYILLTGIDEKWKEHLYSMDQLRNGIGMRSIGQMDPKMEYRKEGYSLFNGMLANLKEEATSIIPRVSIQHEAPEAEEAEAEEVPREQQPAKASGVSESQLADEFEAHGEKMQKTVTNTQTQEEPEQAKKAEPIRNADAKVGRNDACPCGSGKKFKKCCGK